MRLRSSWTESDLVSVREGIYRTYTETKTTGKQWANLIDPLHAYQSIADGEVDAVIHDGYMVAYSIDSPWYNRGIRILTELLVLRVSPNPCRFKSVIDALDILCAAWKCDAIVVGDAAQGNNRLQRAYMRYGFKPQATQLMKGKPLWVD